MDEEYNNNKIETKSADSSSGSYVPPANSVPASEIPEQELYHAKSFWTRWVFSQDAKVIGVQYALTATAVGLIGLVLSWGMRLQLGFPETFSFLGPATYYQSVTMHGMIMVVYLLTALFLGGFGKLHDWFVLFWFFYYGVRKSAAIPSEKECTQRRNSCPSTEKI